ncbi:MAG: hypothetical protein IK016_09720 [Lachnospiraceae bacterium]|nr:hypothetical protein [Lachnospiraceae bacterium]
MATSTFDKSFVIIKPEDQRRILDIIHSDEPAIPIDVPPYSQAERDRAAVLISNLFESEGVTKGNP